MRLIHQGRGEFILLIGQIPLDDGQILGSSDSWVQSQSMSGHSIDVSLAISQRVVQEDDTADGDHAEKGGDDESDDEA